MLAIDAINQPLAKSRNRWCPRFSLAALIVIVFLLGTTLMVLRATSDAQRLQHELHSEKSQVSALLAERRELRDKLGIITVDHPDNIYAIARPKNRYQFSWEWELYLPNRKFNAFYSFVKVAPDGSRLESPKRQFWLGLQGGKSAVYAVELNPFPSRPGNYHGILYSGTPLQYGNLPEANAVSNEVCEAFEKKRLFRHHQMGKDGTIVLPTQEKIVLLWPDVYLWPDVNGIKSRSDYHDINNCHGLTIWLEEEK